MKFLAKEPSNVLKLVIIVKKNRNIGKIVVFSKSSNFEISTCVFKQRSDRFVVPVDNRSFRHSEPLRQLSVADGTGTNYPDRDNARRTAHSWVIYIFVRCTIR